MNINATLIGQTIVFAVFVWFCMKFVWPPIIAAMEERKKRIEDGLIAAERGLANQQEANKKAEELLSHSKNQAAEIIANANKQALATVEEAKGIAVAEANRVLTKASNDIKQAEARVAGELKTQLSDLVMQGVNKVLAKEVGAKQHQEMLGKLSAAL